MANVRVTDFGSPGWECAHLGSKYWSWVVPQFSAPCGDKGLKLLLLFFISLFIPHPVAWHLMAAPFKAEGCRANGSMCRMAESLLPVLQMLNTDTLWYSKAASDFNCYLDFLDCFV